MEEVIQSKKVNMLAKISLSCATFIPIILYLLGIVLPSSILILLVPLSLLLAVILGSIAYCRISKDEEHLRGKNWAILGIIIGGLLLFVIISISASKFWKASQKTTRAQAVGEIESMAEALQRYYNDVGHYPSIVAGLKVLRVRIATDDHDNKYGGPYLLLGHTKYVDNIPLDPWGNEYQYTSDGKSFTLLSYGADSKPGGTGFKADITSEQVKRGEKLW